MLHIYIGPTESIHFAARNATPPYRKWGNQVVITESRKGKNYQGTDEFLVSDPRSACGNTMADHPDRNTNWSQSAVT
jgi:hypothetical protein